MIKIVQKEDKILRKISKNIDIDDISTLKIKKIIENMKQALSEQDDGVAIAAPQIGELYRLFVVSGRVFGQKRNLPDIVFINPKIIKISNDKKSVPEGCLSVRWLYGKTKRASKVSIEALNEEGKQFTYNGSGLMAQIFQHEIDHLDGILFIDHARYIKDIPPELNVSKTKQSK